MNATRRAKEALRARMRTLRASIAVEDREAAAVRLAQAFVGHPLLRGRTPGPVLVPVAHRSEIPTDRLARHLESSGWSIVRPRADAERTHIDAVPWPLDRPLVGGYAGVPEPPPDARPMDPSGLRLILVPGLAFARDGHRLGTGLGFFDRFLAPLQEETDAALTLGIGYALQLVDEVPHEAHDVPLDGLQLEEHAIVARPARA